MILLGCPATRPSKTWRSRGDRAAILSRISAVSECRAASFSCELSAARTAPSKTSLSYGFSIKSTAPCRIAWTARGASACPVMTITGQPTLRFLRRRRSSMPSMSGILTSVMMHPPSTEGMASRKAFADTYSRDPNRAVPSKNVSDCRAASSSSITCTIGSFAIVAFLRGGSAKREAKDRSAACIWLDHDLPAMRFDDSARDRQSDSQSLLFRGDERLEQARDDIRSDPGPRVGHANGNHVVCYRRGRDDKLAPNGALHGLNRVAQQIEQDLLDLDLVDKYEVV